jgi:hypothetical protein
MAGKKRTPEAPEWFRPERYSEAAKLDAGDWLLNLSVRRWLHDEPAASIEAALREHGPLLRRGDLRQMAALRWLRYLGDEVTIDGNAEYFDWADYVSSPPELPSDVREALRTGRVRSGINPLGVSEMYLFERRLPEDVRSYGAAWRGGRQVMRGPKAFAGSLDDAFGPGPSHQMTGRFVRLDLSLPDDVLHADLQLYLKRERQRLAAMGGPQPYREAAGLNARPSPAVLPGTLARIGLLPFLDLDRWQRAERKGKELTFSTVREMAGIDREREPELREYVRRTVRQMKLHAWFARMDRSVEVRQRRRAAERK